MSVVVNTSERDLPLREPETPGEESRPALSAVPAPSGLAEAAALVKLAQAAGSGEEALGHLRRAGAAAPEDARVRALFHQTLLREGVSAAKAQAKERARLLLRELSTLTPGDERVWLWRATVAQGYSEASECLTRVLEISPGHAQAQTALERLRQRAAARTAAAKPADTPAAAPDAATPRDEPEPDRRLHAVAPTQPHEGHPADRAPVAHLDTASATAHDVERAPAPPVPDLRVAAVAEPPAPHLARETTEESDHGQDAAPRVKAWPPRALPFRHGLAPERRAEPTAEPEGASSTAPTTIVPALSVAPAPQPAAPAESQPPAASPRLGSILQLNVAPPAPAREHAAAPPAARVTPPPAPPVAPAMPSSAPGTSPSRPAMPAHPPAAPKPPTGMRQQWTPPAAATPPPAAPAPAPEAEPPRGTVLVVDDSPTVLRVVEFELKRHRLEVVTATHGPEALEKLQTLSPDLVLLDINMPRMDGYQVCRAIRANERTSRIPVVMLSGKDGFFDKIRGRMAGAADYITKPFEASALMAMLEKYFPVRA